MAFEDLDRDELEEDENGNGNGNGDDAPPEEAGNRTFFIIAGLIGLIALALLGCIIIFVLTRARPLSEAARIETQNAQMMATALTQTFEALTAPTFTPTPSRTFTPIPATATVAATQTPTRTSVVVVPPTETPSGTGTGPVGGQDSLTATVAALQTRAAQITQTVIPTATRLPQTGFAEDVGLPTMLGAALLLAIVIILARRLRTA